ncbi:hypothetical protein [Pseudohoeflea coraliihabitans]|uniref:Uncharacterized protein n=1 Tax=Pseudohoeflea coraliihabitans TaxID=2860393 RepID=A0ABS6WIJ3_9HYPH|nr:hypothetical protein [Pseudohoeflea sp. DP4N28-3]MBW3095680.1 hypothetical protein [Pseudohoeflea sp. DP4N28-3]
MSALESCMSPEAVVSRLEQRGIAISERNLRKTARKLGTCRQLGNALFFTEADLEALINSMLVQPKGEDECGSSSAARSGITGSLLTGRQSVDLRERLTSGSRKTSRTSTNSASDVLPFTGRNRS